jgi:hypothetical protein
MSRQQAHRRREAAIATLKTAVTAASVAATLGGCALIGLTDSDNMSVVSPADPQSISAGVTQVGSATPIPSATATIDVPVVGSGSTAAATATQTAAPTLEPTATAVPTETIIQPGFRQPPGSGNESFQPRTRTSR